MSAAPRPTILIALFCSVAATAAALAAFLANGASASLAVTIQAAICAAAQGLVLRASAAEHAAGARRAENDRVSGFWSLVGPILMYAAGAGVVLHEGVEMALEPKAPGGTLLTDTSLAGVLLVAAAILLAFALREAMFKASADGAARPQAVADARRASTPLFALMVGQIAALAGVGLALAGMVAAVQIGAAFADGAATIAIGLLLALVAALATLEAKQVLLAGGGHEMQAPAAAVGAADQADVMTTASAMPTAPAVQTAAAQIAAGGASVGATSGPARPSPHPHGTKKKHGHGRR